MQVLGTSSHNIGDTGTHTGTLVAAQVAVGIVNAQHITRAASTTLQMSNDAAQGVSEVAYTKKKTITLTNGLGGVLRIKFDLLGGPGTVYGTIYKNGVAAGTERSTAGGPTTFSEDLTLTLAAGDTLEVWCKATAGAGPTVSNFRIYFDPATPAYTTSNP